MIDATKKSIKNWAEQDRPREKMMNQGAQILTDSELLAIVIGSGNASKSAVGLAQEILAFFDHKLSLLSKSTINELIQNFKGIGKAKAITILAVAELGRRRKEEHEEIKKIGCSKDVYSFINPKLKDLCHEEFWIIYVNQSNAILAARMQTKGGMTQTVVDVRPIIREALSLSNCTGMVACHNHPSGRLEPSESDLFITNKLKEAASFFDLRLLDHLIVGDDGYFSFKDENFL